MHDSNITPPRMSNHGTTSNMLTHTTTERELSSSQLIPAQNTATKTTRLTSSSGDANKIKETYSSVL
jgi:hypothetical protein